MRLSDGTLTLSATVLAATMSPQTEDRQGPLAPGFSIGRLPHSKDTHLGSDVHD